jgi:phosphoglycolate phosphatase
MSYQAVLFDLDGTLLDTLDDIADSANLVLRQLGFPEYAVEAYKYFIGDGMEVLARRVLPTEHCDEAMIRRYAAGMRKEYGRLWAVKTRPYPGIPELLDALRTRGTRTAVLSNKPDQFTKLCVGRLLADWPFEAVVGQREGVPKKPDPAGALAIARQLGIPSSDILYLGDTNTDMQTAVAARMYPVGALWGFRTADELLTNGANALIAQPLELLQLLGVR